MVQIAGLQKNSVIDFPGHVACVVFFGGCNMNCWFCHNRQIIGNYFERIKTDEIIGFLDKRRGRLDGVVLSGGEPTLQHGLADFTALCRSMGYKVKLDTNGLDYAALKRLLSKSLLDYIAMDIKAPADKYADACCVPIDVKTLRNSIELIKNSGVSYEFRTTFLPSLSPADIEQIAKDMIPGADLYIIQPYKHADTYTKILGMNLDPHKREAFLQAAESAGPYVKAVKIRN